MAAGLPDLVDCARLAEEGAVLRRVYQLSELPRLTEWLAASRGVVNARFAFAKLASGRAGAEVTIEANPQLVCQRCLQGYDASVNAASEIEFAAAETPEAADAEREFFVMEHGRASLKDLAEEELLLALPLVPACSTPLTCGRAPRCVMGDETLESTGDMRRPFSALQDLLKKT